MNHLKTSPNKNILQAQNKDVDIDFERLKNSQHFSKNNFWIAQKQNDKENQIVGCIVLAEISGETAELNTFSIDLNFRRKGIGP